MSTAQRRAREKAQRRKDILAAARREFFERGFRQPTVDDVATRAQVSKGTIYLYFYSKEDILAHLLLEGLELLLGKIEVAAATPLSTAEASLRQLADVYLDFCSANPNYFRLIMAFDRGRFEESISSQLHRRVLDQSLKSLTTVAQTIERGIEQGEFAACDAWEAAGSVWAAINGVLVLAANPMRLQVLRCERHKLYRATLDLVIRGLRKEQDWRKEECTCKT